MQPDMECHGLRMVSGDRLATYEDILDLEQLIGFKSSIPLREGLRSFVRWYAEYHKKIFERTDNAF